MLSEGSPLLKKKNIIDIHTLPSGITGQVELGGVSSNNDRRETQKVAAQPGNSVFDDHTITGREM